VPISLAQQGISVAIVSPVNDLLKLTASYFANGID
jgi:hypothetical protein